MLEPMDNVLNIKKFLFSLISKFIIYLWLFIILTGISFAQETKPIIKIGILANNGIENCKKTWQPTINYLNISMPDHNFQLVPVLYFDMAKYVQNQKIDLVLCNSGQYIELAYHSDLRILATLKEYRPKFYEVLHRVIGHDGNTHLTDAKTG